MKALEERAPRLPAVHARANLSYALGRARHLSAARARKRDRVRRHAAAAHRHLARAAEVEVLSRHRRSLAERILDEVSQV